MQARSANPSQLSQSHPCPVLLYDSQRCHLSLCAGVAFFGLTMAGSSVAGPLAQIGLTPLMAAVLVGAAQNVFSKSAKYALFDPCKEMAYIPLDRETQVCLRIIMLANVMCTCMCRQGKLGTVVYVGLSLSTCMDIVSCGLHMGTCKHVLAALCQSKPVQGNTVFAVSENSGLESCERLC